MPLSVALELALTGDSIDADARRTTSVSSTGSSHPRTCSSAAVAIAERIAANGPLAIAATKELVRLSASVEPPRAPNASTSGAPSCSTVRTRRKARRRSSRSVNRDGRVAERARRRVPVLRPTRGRADRGPPVAAARHRTDPRARVRRRGQLPRRADRRQPVPDPSADAVRAGQRVRRRGRGGRPRGVTEWVVGDRVFGTGISGAFAEEVVCRRRVRDPHPRRRGRSARGGVRRRAPHRVPRAPFGRGRATG